MMEDDIRDVEGAEGKGLSAEEVNKKLLEFGYNEVEEKKSNPGREFLKRFWGLTPWMLEITIVVSYIIHKMLDVYIIAWLFVLNAIIGYKQEEKASKAVELLKKKAANKFQGAKGWKVDYCQGTIPCAIGI